MIFCSTWTCNLTLIWKSIFSVAEKSCLFGINWLSVSGIRRPVNYGPGPSTRNQGRLGSGILPKTVLKLCVIQDINKNCSVSEGWVFGGKQLATMLSIVVGPTPSKMADMYGSKNWGLILTTGSKVGAHPPSGAPNLLRLTSSVDHIQLLASEVSPVWLHAPRPYYAQEHLGVERCVLLGGFGFSSKRQWGVSEDLFFFLRTFLFFCYCNWWWNIDNWWWFLVALFICNLLVNSFACCDAPGGFGDGRTPPKQVGSLGEFHRTKMAWKFVKVSWVCVCWKQRTYILSNGTPHIHHFHSFPSGNFKMRGTITNQYELYIYIPVCMVHFYVSSSTAEPMFNCYPLNSVLIDQSIYLKCWVFSLFHFTGTISTCERFLGKSFFNVFHPFPHFQPFLHFFEGHYCWLSSHWVGVPFHHRNYDWYCTLIGETVKTACGC